MSAAFACSRVTSWQTLFQWELRWLLVWSLHELFTCEKNGRKKRKVNSNFKLDENNLSVFEIFVDEGPKLKRWHPMSRGRAYPIIKRTSHIALILSDGAKTTEKPDKSAKRILTGPSQSRPKASLVGEEKPKTKKTAAKRKTTKK